MRYTWGIFTIMQTTPSLGGSPGGWSESEASEGADGAVTLWSDDDPGHSEN